MSQRVHEETACEPCSGKGFVAAAPLSIKPFRPSVNRHRRAMWSHAIYGAMLDLPWKGGLFSERGLPCYRLPNYTNCGALFTRSVRR